jgi:hypothetical protein
MSSIVNRIAIVGFVVYAFGLGYGARAEKVELLQMPKAEELPTPHALGSDTMEWEEGLAAFFERPLNCTRINRYEIWQFYDVNLQGRFRPRVIYSAYGSFYADDGRPFPWVSNHPREFAPYVVGP